MTHCVLHVSKENLHAIALGLLSLAINPRVCKNEEQLTLRAGKVGVQAVVRLRALEMGDHQPCNAMGI